MDNRLGKILKERRKAKRLTLKQLEEMSGVHTSHLGHIEIGERFPSGWVLKKLAKPLGFGQIELFKLAGFIDRDEIDDRIDRFKKEVREEITEALANLRTEIAQALVNLCKKIDSL